MEIQNSEGRMNCVQCWEEKKNFPPQLESEMLSIYNPFPCTYLNKKPLTLYIMYFFLSPRNLDIMKYTKLTAFKEKKLVVALHTD